MVIYSSRSGAVEVGVISHIYSRLFDKGLHTLYESARFIFRDLHIRAARRYGCKNTRLIDRGLIKELQEDILELTNVGVPIIIFCRLRLPLKRLGSQEPF